jgi:peptide chain release factor 1
MQMKSKKYIEIRPCAGGEEAERLCDLMVSVYKKTCDQNNINISVVNKDTRMVSLIVEGKDTSVFDNESGVHKFQRVPETERKGRVHTSTVSVAALELDDNVEEDLFNENEIKITTMHCTGQGGQNINKVESGVRITHLPTGLVITSTTQRSQSQNKKIALLILSSKLQELKESKRVSETNKQRAEQVREGKRSDARRIYNEQRGEVYDKITGKQCSFKEFLKGKIDKLA